MMARVIRDREADFVSLCVGINIYGRASLNDRTFGPSVIGFVKIIREKHADIPLVVMSPIVSPERETTKNAAGFTLKEMRVEVEKAVDAFKENGDRNIHYVNGPDILKADHANLMPDGVHPNPEGYRIMGRNFLDKVAKKFFV